ncbi:TetR family transcriptional regulator [Streptomyces sp. NPDC002405]
MTGTGRQDANGDAKRPLGRPRRVIDPDALAATVAKLYEEDGHEGVSVTAAADRLNVSRATLYRTYPTKEHIIAVLFERSTQELTASAEQIVGSDDTAREKLEALITLQVDASVRMRGYLPVFFGGGGLPPDSYERWRSFSRHYENLWVKVLKDAMANGLLAEADPVVTARLLLGQCLWISRWYRPGSKYTRKVITQAALALLPPAV